MSMSNATTPGRLCVNKINAAWSPLEDRIARDENGTGKMKVRSLHNNTRTLRGGDWIFGHHGNCTLGVAWKENGKQYGLTVAHIFTEFGETVGDSVFAYDSDEAVMFKNGTTAHKKLKVGTVVSIDMETDSAVFEIFPTIAIEPLALSGSNDRVHKIKLPRPFASATAPPSGYGQKLVMFGAACRAMSGFRVKPVVRPADISAKFATESYVRNAKGALVANGAVKLSFSGDCGALYIDEAGMAWCMHTTIQGLPRENPKVWTSGGALLQLVVNKHPFFFGYLPSIDSDLSFESQSSSPAQFCDGTVSVVLTQIVAPDASGRYPCAYFPDEDEDCYIEFQRGLPRSRIPTHNLEEDDENTMNAFTSEIEEEKKLEE